MTIFAGKLRLLPRKGEYAFAVSRPPCGRRLTGCAMRPGVPGAHTRNLRGYRPKADTPRLPGYRPSADTPGFCRGA